MSANEPVESAPSSSAEQRPILVPSTFDPPAAPAPANGVVRRLAARFALVAFGLYHLPLVLNDYPTLGGGGLGEDGLSVAWGHVFGQVGLWVARHVFDVTGPMGDALRGDNGDTVEEYCRLLVAVVVAAVAAAIWTFADRRRPRARWVEDALHVLLRYAIILGLASYAMAKLYPVQFGQLSPSRLETRVGELSPMGLLWAFMEYSPVYSTFAGIMELAAVLLLCFRRTATLGALICVPVMLNVMLMNTCYDVVVKLYSISLFVAALVLVLHDARRLADLLVFHRAIPARPVRPPFRSRRLNQARWIVKLVLVGGVLLSSAVAMHELCGRIRADEASPLHGTWDVTSFVVAGRDLTHTAEPSRWRRVAVGLRGFAVRLEDDTLLTCRPKPDDATRTLSLTCSRTHQDGTLHWTRRGDELQLEGSFGAAPVTATLKRRDESQLRLLHDGFHWTYDG
jgi:putative flippase GtrA